MLEQMGKAGVASGFVLRSHVVPQIHGHDRTGVILVQEHVEAVRERVFAEGDVHRTTVSGIVGRV